MTSDIPIMDAVVLAEVVSSVTQTMCGVSFGVAQRTQPMPDRWRLAVLPILGHRRLIVSLFSDRASCCTLSAGMFKLPANEIDESLIEDALRELLNISAGQIKNALVPDQTLGLPRIVPAQEIEAHLAHITKGVLLKAESSVNLYISVLEAPPPGQL
jgi:hypothetical protein